MLFAPLEGQREVLITSQRTKVDYAHAIKHIVDEMFPQAEKIRLVQDNLNTHTVGALYEAFAPAEARRLAQKLEIHYTPKHGSWLNMAEIELSALSIQCLDRRIPDTQTLQSEVNAWAEQRNDHCATVNWQFTTADARTKLHRLYPSIQPR